MRRTSQIPLLNRVLWSPEFPPLERVQKTQQKHSPFPLPRQKKQRFLDLQRHSTRFNYSSFYGMIRHNIKFPSATRVLYYQRWRVDDSLLRSHTPLVVYFLIRCRELWWRGPASLLGATPHHVCIRSLARNSTSLSTPPTVPNRASVVFNVTSNIFPRFVLCPDCCCFRPISLAHSTSIRHYSIAYRAIKFD